MRLRRLADLCGSAALPTCAGAADGYCAVHVFTVGDGKITRFREYTDLDAAFA